MARFQPVCSRPGRLRVAASRLLCTLALVFAVPGAALAVPSFELTLADGNVLSPFNVSAWTLRNTSTAGESITSFSITIGDTGYEFDYIRDASSSFPFYTISPGVTGVSVLTGNGFGGGAGFDRIDLGFSDFDAGEQLDFELDIDETGFFGGIVTDARTVLFNNGLAANGTLSIGFDDGSSFDVTMPDADPSATSFVFGPSGSGMTPVPEPGTALLMGLGLASMGLAGRRRRA